VWHPPLDGLDFDTAMADHDQLIFFNTMNRHALGTHELEINSDAAVHFGQFNFNPTATDKHPRRQIGCRIEMIGKYSVGWRWFELRRIRVFLHRQRAVFL
jgi:hypothetical protein